MYSIENPMNDMVDVCNECMFLYQRQFALSSYTTNQNQAVNASGQDGDDRRILNMNSLLINELKESDARKISDLHSVKGFKVNEFDAFKRNLPESLHNSTNSSSNDRKTINIHIPALGHFESLPDGRIKIRFNDRTHVELDASYTIATVLDCGGDTTMVRLARIVAFQWYISIAISFRKWVYHQGKESDVCGNIEGIRKRNDEFLKRC